MTLKKFIVIPIIIAILAATLQMFDTLLSPAGIFPEGNKGFTWIAFQAWAVYFLGGCNVKGGIKALIGYATGIVASIAIMELAGAVGGSVGSFFAAPVAIAIVVVPVILLEKVKWMDYIPAIFVGSGAFFAFMAYVPNATYTSAATTEMIYCLIGVVYGYITVLLRTAYEKKVGATA